MLLTNPAVIAVLVMVALSLARLNILLAIISATLVGGLMGGLGLVDTTRIMINGMQGNLETALSYILLGALAVTISSGNLMKVVLFKLVGWLDQKRTIFCFLIAFIACFSQNLIPVHIAFIPILIPPLLHLMNRLQVDRRAVACALTFGLQAPYMTIPAGFGLIFLNLIVDNLHQNGIQTNLSEVVAVMSISGLAMLCGLVVAILVLYRKPRIYEDRLESSTHEELKLQKKDYLALVGIVLAFVVQILTGSLPLGAFIGLMVMLVGGVIKWRQMDMVIDEGVKMMAFVAFVMLVASGFGEVLQKTHAITDLVHIASGAISGKFAGALIMLVIGLFITLGIGTSFGTLPIIATFYCPLCVALGFDTKATILLIGIAAGLGDAGSPASDSTIGPTTGLNADQQHNHIYDTCIPTFLVYNIPLMVFGIVGALLL
ncbi:Histidine permease [Helicobacter sp. NHP19-012]|uniref:Histidine permease n=1 Tax=Helicobacter gastrofelis TaxID=2849642 RepID=A0ABM7SG02_9HELI|nr:MULTISPECIES: Na+/H+ antiporter NhaC family protein [unclassified Helicobacter]BCZ19321.1 Histidine permease [Helicobacter sp. NHP19-012]GMB96095.1 Histidine permease [Helicobacter sp. NHP22-001]